MSYTIKDILRMEVAPALGCTEPSAVALCTAAAAALLPVNEYDTIELHLDPNIYKNGIAVSIPGAEGNAGIELAAALGALGGDPALKLEVLASVTRETLKKAQRFVKEHNVVVSVLHDKRGLYVRAVVQAGSHSAEAVIEATHDNIVSLRLDGNPVTEHPLLSVVEESHHTIAELEEWLKEQSLQNLISLAEDMDEDDMTFVREGVDYNVKLAEYGLTYGPGLGIGLTLERLVKENLIKKDMVLAAKIMTAAACDARMSGATLPAMSSAGSGNHGLTAILPIWAVKDYVTIEDETSVLKAIGLSHVITGYVKAHTGRLTAICGCSVAAGAGAAGGVTYLMSGNLHHIAGAIKNLIGDLAGVICDGAKAGCALKLATAAGTAVQSALYSLHGIDVKSTDGIIGRTPEQTMKNIGQLSTEGMIEADHIILDIMLKKHLTVSE